MNIASAARRQYNENHTSLAFFTMAIIALHENRPATKAPMKPIANGMNPRPAADAGSPKLLRIPNACSPMIGTRTIRNENCAMFSRFTPQRSPVAMVVPDLESPGATAHA